MSVTQVRNFIEKSGCGVIVAVAVGLVMLLGVFTGQCSRGARANEAAEKQNGQAGAGTVVGTVGETPITAEEIDKAQQESIAQMQLPESQGVLFEAQTYGYAVSNVVNEALIGGLAKKYGITVSDDDIKKEASIQAEAQIGQMKSQLIQSNKVKADASSADMDAVFLKEYQVSVSEATTRLVDRIMEDAASKKQIRQMVIYTKAKDKAKESVTINDADLKKAQELLTVKRIFVPTSDTAKATIEKAAGELKGGATFEATMQKYTKDAPSAGKPITEREEPFLMQQAFSNDKLAAMKTAKLGFVSPPLEIDGGWAIYKVTKVSPAPADFEKNKDSLRTQYAEMAAGSQISMEHRAMRDTTKPKWTDSGYEALYEANDTGSKQGDARTKALEAVLQIADSGGPGKRAGAYAKYLAMENLWPTLKPEQQKAKSAQRLEIITRLLEFTDGADLQLTIARILADNKDIAAGDALLKAAQQNMSYGPRGQQLFGDVSGLLSRLKAQKLIKDEVATEIAKVQTEWQQNKALAEAEQKKQAEEQEKQRKALEAEQKKYEEEEKKRKAEEEKNKAKGGAAKPEEGQVSSDSLTKPSGPAPTPGLPTKP